MNASFESMKFLGCIFLFIAVIMNWTSPVIALESDSNVSLSVEERVWLKAHPTIRLAYPPGHEPTLMEDGEGKLVGVLADYFELINQRLETNISLTLVPWQEVDGRIRNKEIEGLAVATSRRVKALGLLPTKRKLSSYVVVYGQGPADSLKFPDDLHGSRVAVLSGYNHTDFAVDQIRDKAEIVPVKSPREGLESVHQGRVDFFIGAISNNYLISKYQFFGIAALHVFWDQPYRVGPAARSDLPELATILEKGASLITDDEFDVIVARWTKVRRAEMQVELTPDERIWLDQHPNIELGYTDAFEPELIVNPDGSYRGTLIDVLDLVNKRLGTDIKVAVKPIPDLIDQVNKKELAGVLAIHPTYADKLGWLTTQSYMTSYPTVFTRKDFNFNTPADLAGKKIALIDKVFFSQNLVNIYGEEATPVKVESALKGMGKVKDGTVDLFIGSSSNSYLLGKYQFFDLATAFQFYDYPITNVMGVRSDWPQLVSILNKGLQSISVEEIESIYRKWIIVPEQIEAIELTADEQTWLAQKHTVRVRATNWPPYMIIKENGLPEGISVEYLKLISERSGIDFEYEVTNQPFADFLENMEQHQGPDLTSLIVSTPEREQYLSFTTPYTSSPYVIFARDNGQIFLDLNSLDGKTVALPRGFIMQKFLERDFPEINLVLLENSEQALLAVSTGKVDAYIGNLTVSTHILQKSGLSNLRIVGATTYGDQVLSMGSRKDWPELTSIMNKALASITEEEKTAIRNKYIALRYEQGIDRAEVMKWVLVIIAVTATILFLFFFWNRLLALKVKKRTAALESEINERKRVEELFSKAFHYQPNAMQIINVKTGERREFNDAYVKLCGYSEDELLENSVFTQSLWVDIQKQKQVTEELVKNGYVIDFPMDIRTKSGEIRHLLGSASLLDLEDGNLAIAAHVDITEHKQAQERVQQYQQRLKAMASQLTIVEEKERSRLAADLHDHVGQTLAFSRIQIAKAKKYASEEKLVSILDEISQSLLKAIQDTKELVFDLSSPLLNELGIRAATHHWLEENVGRKHGIEFELVGAEIRSFLSKDVRSILFRNVRELLANVIRHAQATKVLVSLVDNVTDLKIVVSDNGIGCDVHELKNREGGMKKFGLFSIRERMEDMGGSMEIISEPGKGCRVILFIPLDPNNEQAATEI